MASIFAHSVAAWTLGSLYARDSKPPCFWLLIVVGYAIGIPVGIRAFPSKRSVRVLIDEVIWVDILCLLVLFLGKLCM